MCWDLHGGKVTIRCDGHKQTLTPEGGHLSFCPPSPSHTRRNVCCMLGMHGCNACIVLLHPGWISPRGINCITLCRWRLDDGRACAAVLDRNTLELLTWQAPETISISSVCSALGPTLQVGLATLKLLYTELHSSHHRRWKRLHWQLRGMACWSWRRCSLTASIRSSTFNWRRPITMPGGTHKT